MGVLAKLNDKNYFTKYITKTIRYNENDNKHILTLSLSWFFRKRSFYINYKLLALLFNLRLDCNMRSDPPKNKNEEEFYIKEKVVLAKNMGFDPKKWKFETIEWWAGGRVFSFFKVY
jgi:hypothetical protein